MMESDFLSCDGAPNAKFLNWDSYLCKGKRCGVFFFLSGYQNSFFTTWASITHISQDGQNKRRPPGRQASKFMLPTFNDGVTVVLYRNRNRHLIETVYVTHVEC